MFKKFSLTALLFAVALLTACGGGGQGAATTPQSPQGPATPTGPAGGLYVGYYQEDPATNPEDPTAGAFSLNLPNGDGSFAGSMYFTYVGCQTSNVGTVSGTKAGNGLSGTWSGLVDNLMQSGTYSGNFDSNSQTYAGTFLNAGGKQFRDLSPCIQYFIAPNGTWEMFAIQAHIPSTFVNTITGRTVNWPAVTNASYTLVYVLDPVIAQSSGNPVVWQTLVRVGVSTIIPGTVTLQPGKEYIVATAVFNAQSQRLAFSSARFTP